MSKYYTVSGEPKYINQVLVILEGELDGEYLTSEQTFNIERFKKKVAKDLCDILKQAYDIGDMELGELANDTFDLSFTNIANCSKLSGHEVMYFDENGVCKDILMNWRM